MASEVMPCLLASANRSSSRAAPSSMEYSVWMWRWVKSAAGTGPSLGGRSDGVLLPCRSTQDRVEQFHHRLAKRHQRGRERHLRHAVGGRVLDPVVSHEHGLL